MDSTRPNGGPYSFPSGHTAVAFSAAPILAQRYGWKTGLAAYALATATGLARMEDRKHHLADVLAGAAIGIGVGREVSRRMNRSRILRHVDVSPVSVGFSIGF